MSKEEQLLPQVYKIVLKIEKGIERINLK